MAANEQTYVYKFKQALGALDKAITSTANISTSGNIATTGSGTITSAGTLVASGAATVGTTLAVTGATTLTGGIAQGTAISGVHNLQITGATNGTDTAFADGTQFVTSIFVPVNFTCTNIEFLVGSVGGTDACYGVIYDADGTAVANSSVAGGGATVGTAAQIQQLALTSTYAMVGPAMFYVGISANGATAKIRTAPVYLGASLFGGSVSQTHGTVGDITPPTTFTADKAPYVILT